MITNSFYYESSIVICLNFTFSNLYLTITFPIFDLTYYFFIYVRNTISNFKNIIN